MNKLNYILSIFLLQWLLAGCASYNKSIYLRNDVVLDEAEQLINRYEYRIKPMDELVIVVNTSDPASSVPFLRKLGQSKELNQNSQGTANAKLLNYLVDYNGFIDYPVLGKFSVSGLTCRECEELICKKLEFYLNEVPNVTVRLESFKISVLGEVNRPGNYTTTNERVSIFWALAEAGDMTLLADRDDVQILREDSLGRRHAIHLDLTEADVALSPEYYLQQNDVVYVRPTKAKVHSNTFSNNASIWICLLSLVATLTSLAILSFR